jgi:dihydrofolate reductase
MRTLRLQVQISVDGFVATKDGGLDWMTWNWDDKLKEYTSALNDPITTILLGKNMTEGFINHWSKVAEDPQNPEHEFGRQMIDTPKVVFSKTIKDSNWPNTIVAGGNLHEEIKNIKLSGIGDIIVYGGATFVSNLIRENLIDEYQLFINPVLLGSGMRIFDKLKGSQDLELKKATGFECGITVLHYELKK